MLSCLKVFLRRAKTNCDLHYAYILLFFATGVTVCVMSVFGVRPREMGESIIISRLEKGSAPITVHIPTSKEQVSMMNE